jgi:hypothetical protein
VDTDTIPQVPNTRRVPGGHDTIPRLINLVGINLVGMNIRRSLKCNIPRLINLVGINLVGMNIRRSLKCNIGSRIIIPEYNSTAAIPTPEPPQ